MMHGRSFNAKTGHASAAGEAGSESAREVLPEPAEILAFALLHDAWRQDDRTAAWHGLAADRAVQDGDPAAAAVLGFLGIPTDARGRIGAACARHSDADAAENAIEAICRDADRLDLVRFGREPRPDLLATRSAKALAASHVRRPPPSWEELLGRAGIPIGPRG